MGRIFLKPTEKIRIRSRVVERLRQLFNREFNLAHPDIDWNFSWVDKSAALAISASSRQPSSYESV